VKSAVEEANFRMPSARLKLGIMDRFGGLTVKRWFSAKGPIATKIRDRPAKQVAPLGVSPLAEQIVIDPRQAYARVVISTGTT
jgi:hypothetical protein